MTDEKTTIRVFAIWAKKLFHLGSNWNDPNFEDVDVAYCLQDNPVHYEAHKINSRFCI